jgi:hypothetical protein
VTNIEKIHGDTMTYKNKEMLMKFVFIFVLATIFSMVACYCLLGRFNPWIFMGIIPTLGCLAIHENNENKRNEEE